jgi:hypothetical protein
VLLAIIVLITLVASAVLALIGTRFWPFTLSALSLGWLLVNKPLEGPVLWVLTPGHGLALSDLLCPLGLGLAAVLLYHRRASSTGQRTFD